MSYGRQTAMDGLRKAGMFLGDIDEQYANKIEAGAMKNMERGGILEITEGIRGFTSGVPLRDTWHGFSKTENRKEVMQQAAMDLSVMGANVASRYALPAGGVTLAGKGLMDIAAAFGGAADEPAPNQLPLN